MTQQTCTRCLLTDQVPGVKMGEGGQCSACTEHDRTWGNWNEVKKDRQASLERLFEKARKKNRIYDVLVPLSGGKDSTYVLYLCRKRFNLKCLAVTFDNGFLSDHAKENIRKACEVLEVDHAYFSLNRNLTMRLYRYAFLKTGYLCPICLGAMGAMIPRFQKAFGIPLAVKGTSPRTEEYISGEFFVCSNDFVENVFIGSPLESEARLLLEPAGIFKSPPSVQMPNYWDWNYDEIYTTITNELGWQAHSHRAEHTDCTIDNIVNWIRFKRFPALVPEMLRFSKLVTVGQMSRDEAIKAVAEKKADREEPSNLSVFLGALNITREEFDAAVANPLKHLPYLKSRSRVARRLKALIRRFKP
jgi:hypothetical protein